MNNKNIPLIDLTRQMNKLREKLDDNILDLIYSGKYIMGENVREFENEFSKYLGVKNSISVGNGTDGLVIALKALGIKEGDEVITSPFTFFATAESIASVGAIPVFVDVEKETFNIDPLKIEEKINSKTKAIMPVHIFGKCANMEKINEIAKKHKIKVIEDACQAIGASYNNKKAGSMGDIGVFSFFPTKNLGGAGDGGMVVTNDDDLALYIKALKLHGSGESGLKAYNYINKIDENNAENNSTSNPTKYYNYIIGQNSRLDEIQALILREKLKHIDEYNKRRQEIAKTYKERLAKTFVIPEENEINKSVYHLFIVQSENRSDVIDKLKEKNIATGVYYPVPLHLQKVFNYLGYKKGDFPVAEYLSERTFAIPMFPELNMEEIDYITESILEI